MWGFPVKMREVVSRAEFVSQRLPDALKAAAYADDWAARRRHSRSREPARYAAAKKAGLD